MDVWRRGTRRATGAELANAAHEATMRKALQNLTNSGGAGALESGKKRAAAARSEGGSCAEEPAAKRLSQGVAGASSGAGSKRPLIAGRDAVASSRARLYSLLDDEDDGAATADAPAAHAAPPVAPPPGDKGALIDPTHRSYPFSAAGGRMRQESAHPTSPYLNAALRYYNAVMRQTLVDWLMIHAERQSCEAEALHLAVRYADDFLARRGPDAFLADSRARPALNSAVAPAMAGRGLAAPAIQGQPQPPLCNKLKRLGITCLWVATKAAESGAPSCSAFCDAANVPLFDRSMIITAERALLRTLNFDTLLPTAAIFATAFIDAAAGGGWLAGEALVKATQLAAYLLDLSLLPHESRACRCSLMGAAAASLAMQAAGRVRWRDSPLPALSGYGSAQLASARGLLLAVARDAPRFAAVGLLPGLSHKHQGLARLGVYARVLATLHADPDAR